MANERTFVTMLMKAIKEDCPDAFVWKPADAFNLGIPDIHIVIDGRFVAAEAKRISKLLKEDIHDDNERPLLKHTFSGPQISFMRKLRHAGAVSYGIIQVHKDIAYCIHPQHIPLDGQVTQKMLALWGRRVTRSEGWKFW